MNDNVCPFCGGDIFDEYKHEYSKVWQVTCAMCGATGPNGKTLEEAYEKFTIVRPLPCIRDEHGDIKMQSVKDLFQKINGELDELKDAIISYDHAQMRYDNEPIASALLGKKDCEHISEEACDTITAITTMLEALGIDAEMRAEAQRRVNHKNRERGRL